MYPAGATAAETCSFNLSTRIPPAWIFTGLDLIPAWKTGPATVWKILLSTPKPNTGWWAPLKVGFHSGFLWAHTGKENRSGVPTPDEVFPPSEIPGLAAQTWFVRTGGYLQFDYRDKPRGPRSGGNYYVHYTHYSDRGLHQHSYQQLETAAEQYIPYFNKSRVIALRFGINTTYAYNGQTVPFYLQSTLGGNDLLRGFARYRFADDNSVLATAEHRWYVTPGVHAALFVEAGKVAPRGTLLNPGHLD
jgi:outer membrane protein assembly factor BamA